MPLTDIALKALKPKDKEGKMAFGAYPEITLAKSREKRDDARRLIAEGINPAEQKKN